MHAAIVAIGAPERPETKFSKPYLRERGNFQPFARRYANGEVHHFLRDRGFLIKVPPSWRELHARGRKLQGAGVPREAVAQRLGVNQSRWEEIERACGVEVVPLWAIEPL